MISQSYGIEIVLLYHILTDTDSTLLLFHIICKPGNSIPDSKFIDVMFEVIFQNDIISRFDTTNEFLDKFNVRDKTLEKKLGYFEIQSVDNSFQIVVAVNPKEYYEHFENFDYNKKHKGQKKEPQE